MSNQLIVAALIIVTISYYAVPDYVAFLVNN